MARLKIYYLLANKPQISYNSGDSINEVNNIFYLSNFYDVYYNNQKIDLKIDNFGQYKSKIEKPDKIYDFYYIRNNPSIFLELPKDKIKIYFASPYNKDCFEYANYISCLTNNWKIMLKKPNKNWGILYTDEFYTNKTIVLSQKIDPLKFFPINNINIFHKYSISDNIFKICHFGSFRNSCYPSFIIKLYENLDEEFKKKIKIIFIGNIPDDFKKKYNNFFYINNIPLTTVNTYINSCQLLLYNQRDYQSEYAGSNKIIEAIICNKPILCIKSKARIDELGIDYPLFYTLKYKPPDNPKNIYKDDFIDILEILRIKNILINIVNNKIEYNKIVNYIQNIDKNMYLTTYNVNCLLDLK